MKTNFWDSSTNFCRKICVPKISYGHFLSDQYDNTVWCRRIIGYTFIEYEKNNGFKQSASIQGSVASPTFHSFTQLIISDSGMHSIDDIRSIFVDHATAVHAWDESEFILQEKIFCSTTRPQFSKRQRQSYSQVWLSGR